jgi:transcriptional regulator with XRE-family HTH domain
MSRHSPSAIAVDHLVGARLRERRTMLGWTQKELAERIGITYQQLHKYEEGVNRISAARLFRCAQELHTPIDFFFQDMGGEATHPLGARQRRALSLSRAFNEIPEAHLQRALTDLARMLAQPLEPRAPRDEGS